MPTLQPEVVTPSQEVEKPIPPPAEAVTPPQVVEETPEADTGSSAEEGQDQLAVAKDCSVVLDPLESTSSFAPIPVVRRDRSRSNNKVIISSSDSEATETEDGSGITPLVHSDRGRKSSKTRRKKRRSRGTTPEAKSARADKSPGK